MSQVSVPPAAVKHGKIYRAIESVGETAFNARDGLISFIALLGAIALLAREVALNFAPSLLFGKVQIGRVALLSQMVRVGVRSVPIVALVQVFIGIILALQMAPTLETYGQLERVADIVAIAIFRELGPLISAIVLSGFAGASIAAELGAMVEGEEIKALKAMALSPIQYLVVPRVIATMVMLTALAVFADIVGVFGGYCTSTVVLNIDSHTYVAATRAALKHRDFITGLIKACVFGTLISLIACHEGLNVRGGAEGVGRATTSTVVRSIVALIGTDCLFTAIFYAFGW